MIGFCILFLWGQRQGVNKNQQLNHFTQKKFISAEMNFPPLVKLCCDSPHNLKQYHLPNSKQTFNQFHYFPNKFSWKSVYLTRDLFTQQNWCDKLEICNLWKKFWFQGKISKNYANKTVFLLQFCYYIVLIIMLYIGCTFSFISLSPVL